MIDCTQQPVKMLYKFLLIALCCAAASATGQLQIVAPVPQSLQFAANTAGELPSPAVAEVLAASLGLSVNGNTNWNGLTIRDPFNIPHIAVAVVVDGQPGQLLGATNKLTYPLQGAGARDALAALEERVPHVQHLELFEVAEDKQAAKQSYTDLKPTTNADEREFVAKVASLAAAAERIAAEAEPCLVEIELPFSLLAKSSAKGQAEGGKLVDAALVKLSAALQKRFDGEALLAVVALGAEDVQQQQLKRQKRQAAPVEADKNAWNLAADYNEDYPVIFNIILWFGVIFAFSLLAISYAIGNMDPGRDSIIYRMTSTRMKKDN